MNLKFTCVGILALAAMACSQKSEPGSAPKAPEKVDNGINYGGVDGSGGGSLRPESGSAWFVGNDKVISFCIQEASDFGIDQAKVKDIVVTTFKKWRDYAAERNMTEFAYKLSFNETCNNKTDLTFYLGVETPEITAEKSHYKDPVALNIRNSFDIKKGWSQGLIWLAKPWSVNPNRRQPDYYNDKRLSGILLHEIGHVFGNGHVDNTIMSENIDTYMNGDSPATIRLGMIDQNRELSHPYVRTIKYDGSIAVEYTQDSYRTDNFISEFNFKRLTGRAPVGEIKAELEVAYTTFMNDVTLIYSDAKGRFDFPFTLVNQKCGKGDVSVFKVLYLDENGSWIWHWGDPRACVYSWSLVAKDGTTLPVQLDSNINSNWSAYLKVELVSTQWSTVADSLFTLMPMASGE